ncbi:hypothetical protein HK101_011716 [Irineochytrium annulatum]|nr:hypothetical protein HK101_011716 [Irineochytrium annulatum]
MPTGSVISSSTANLGKIKLPHLNQGTVRRGRPTVLGSKPLSTLSFVEGKRQTSAYDPIQCKKISRTGAETSVQCVEGEATSQTRAKDDEEGPASHLVSINDLHDEIPSYFESLLKGADFTPLASPFGTDLSSINDFTPLADPFVTDLSSANYGFMDRRWEERRRRRRRRMAGSEPGPFVGGAAGEVLVKGDGIGQVNEGTRDGTCPNAVVLEGGFKPRGEAKQMDRVSELLRDRKPMVGDDMRAGGNASDVTDAVPSRIVDEIAVISSVNDREGGGEDTLKHDGEESKKGAGLQLTEKTSVLGEMAGMSQTKDGDITVDKTDVNLPVDNPAFAGADDIGNTFQSVGALASPPAPKKIKNGAGNAGEGLATFPAPGLASTFDTVAADRITHLEAGTASTIPRVNVEDSGFEGGLPSTVGECINESCSCCDGESEDISDSDSYLTCGEEDDTDEDAAGVPGITMANNSDQTEGQALTVEMLWAGKPALIARLKVSAATRAQGMMKNRMARIREESNRAAAASGGSMPGDGDFEVENILAASSDWEQLFENFFDPEEPAPAADLMTPNALSRDSASSPESMTSGCSSAGPSANVALMLPRSMVPEASTVLVNHQAPTDLVSNLQAENHLNREADRITCENSIVIEENDRANLNYKRTIAENRDRILELEEELKAERVWRRRVESDLMKANLLTTWELQDLKRKIEHLERNAKKRREE